MNAPTQGNAPKEPAKNKDGFVPGQPVDDQMVRNTEAKRRKDAAKKG